MITSASGHSHTQGQGSTPNRQAKKIKVMQELLRAPQTSALVKIPDAILGNAAEYMNVKDRTEAMRAVKFLHNAIQPMHIDQTLSTGSNAEKKHMALKGPLDDKQFKELLEMNSLEITEALASWEDLSDERFQDIHNAALKNENGVVMLEALAERNNINPSQFNVLVQLDIEDVTEALAGRANMTDHQFDRIIQSIEENDFETSDDIYGMLAMKNTLEEEQFETLYASGDTGKRGLALREDLTDDQFNRLFQDGQSQAGEKYILYALAEAEELSDHRFDMLWSEGIKEDQHGILENIAGHKAELSPPQFQQLYDYVDLLSPDHDTDTEIIKALASRNDLDDKQFDDIYKLGQDYPRLGLLESLAKVNALEENRFHQLLEVSKMPENKTVLDALLEREDLTADKLKKINDVKSYYDAQHGFDLLKAISPQDIPHLLRPEEEEVADHFLAEEFA